MLSVTVSGILDVYRTVVLPESQQRLCGLGDLRELFTPGPRAEVAQGGVLSFRVVPLNPGRDDAVGEKPPFVLEYYPGCDFHLQGKE